MNCPKCNSGNYVKDGIVKGKQRYLCKSKMCNYRYTVKKRAGEISHRIKREAVDQYLEGLTYRKIGRNIGISHVSVMNALKEFKVI